MVINDEWYEKLFNNGYSERFIIDAGYFPEDLPYNKHYNMLELPYQKTVIQFSGAFFPFHEGHLNNIKSTIDYIDKENGIVVIHIDHNSYRAMKGKYCLNKTKESFSILENLFPYKGWSYTLIDENNFKNNCSRNFTRIYKILTDLGNDVYFLCGGDRANFSLAFIDDGKCIVSGRSIDAQSFKEEYDLSGIDRISFIDRDDGFSSSKIREEYLKMI